MPMPWKNQPDLLSMLVALLMTTLGAVASYANRVIKGDKFSWFILTLQIIVSVFAGSLMILAGIHYMWPLEVTGGICGLAGWSGPALIKALEARFLSKAGGANANQ